MTLETEPRGRTSASLLVVLGASLFGTTGTAMSQVPGGVDPWTTGSLRLLIGGCILALVARRRIPSLRHSLGLVLMGSAAVAVYQLAFFWAVVDTGVAVSTLAAIGVSPLASRLIGESMHRPPPSSIWFLSALLLIGGLTGLVVGGYDGLVVRPLGVVSAVVAGTAFAGYTEVAAVSIGRGAHPDAALGAMFAMAGVMTVPVLLFRPIDVLQSWSGLLVVSHLSLVTLTVAYMAFGRGLRQLPPTSATMLTMAEPLVATVLAVLIVGERLSAIGWIGAFLLLGGLIAVARSTRYQAATVLS